MHWIDPLQAKNNNYLVHWGRSKANGAPGVGTGNWKRGSSGRVSQKKKRVAKRELNDYVESEYFLKSDRAGFDSRYVETSSSDPNWRYADVKFKKPKPLLTEGSLEGKVRDSDKNKKKSKKEKQKVINTEYEDVETSKKEEKTKKKYKEPSAEKDMDQKTATETIKADTEYRKAVKENIEAQTKTPTSAEFQKAANNARQAATGIENVSKGVDKAWNSLHEAKYANEDRSKNVRGLTNDELRKTIERIELDQRYNKLTMPPKSKGYDRTMAALAFLGSAATVTATGLSIAATYQSLKKR